jgi:CRISPR-associated protein Cmr5
MQTIQQRRAKHALEAVKKAKQDKISQKEFKSYASGFPAMIQMNGLGQAAAFYRSKAGSDTKGQAYNALYDLLSDWLTESGQPYETSDDLLQGIIEKDMHNYRRAQAEALALLVWVKRFAKAFMEAEG